MTFMRLLSALCLALAWSAPATGQVDRQMAEMFGGMSNDNKPGVHMGVRRGVISGGSFHYRGSVVNPGPVVAFRPPSWSGSCGGIDLYGGSLSAISKQAFEDYLRSIISAAPGYFFQLGMKTVCPGCEDTMSKLGDVVRSFNFKLQDSCEMARGLVLAAKGESSDAMANQAASFQRMGTAVRDMWSASGGGEGNEPSPAEQRNTEDPDAAREEIAGNVIWRVLNDPNVSTWFKHMNQQTREELMSMVGTVVHCVPGDGECPAPAPEAGGNKPQQKMTYTPHEPALGLLQLIRGSQPGEPRVTVFQCRDRRDCYGVSTVVREDFVGFGTRVREVLLGKNGAPGLIAKFAKGEGEPTTEELAIMSANGRFATQVIRLAKRSPEQAEDFAMKFADHIASDVVGAYMKQVFDATRRGLAEAQGRNPLYAEARDLINEARARAIRDQDDLRSMAEGEANALAYFERIERLLPERQQPDLSIIRVPNAK